MTLFFDFLNKRLNEPLPGINSHLKMAPKVLQRSFRNLTPACNSRHSSVLVPIIAGNDPEIIFTLRSEKLKNHKGQISFPGGRVESNESPLDAALRETFEEIGISANEITIIGKISDLYVPPSNSLIHPFIGLLKKKPNYIINPDEVEECFSIPISHFFDTSRNGIRQVVLEGYEVDMPYWDIGKQIDLWGATSMILREFLDLYEEFAR